MKRTAGANWYTTRYGILKRDNFTCRYCGQYAPNVVLHVDHVIAVADGGTDAEDNLVTACAACNRGKEGLRARARVGGRFSSKQTSIEERIKDLLRRGDLTTEEMVSRLGIHRNTVYAILSRLRSKGTVFHVHNSRAPWSLVEDE